MSVITTSIDRLNAQRTEPGIVDRLRADPATRVVVVRDGKARIEHNALVTVRPADVEAALWGMLGRRADGTPLLLAVDTDAPDGPSWQGVREAHPQLGAEDLELLVESVTLAAWMHDMPFCPMCGGEAALAQAGWSRQCRSCGREHFPRTDPAVIVAIESRDRQRLLLGANVLWHGKVFSCFAGFVEAGESLEYTVHREIEEEAGVRLSDVRYFDSQPWPFPRSLMIGFHAVATDETLARPDGEEIVSVRWFTRAEVAAAIAGEGPVRLPGPASLAHRLIRDWLARG